MKLTPETLTPEMVEQSVEESMKGVIAQAKELDALMNEVGRTIQANRQPFRKMIRLQEVRDAIIDRVSPYAACKSGCHHCCMMAVTISSHEAKKIGEHIGIKPKYVPMTMDRDQMVQAYMGVPCPFLKQKKCSIYEVRPSACRTHFNMSAYPQVCDVVEFPGRDVPNINWWQYWVAESVVAMQMGSTFGDLREYFPDGGDVVESL